MRYILICSQVITHKLKQSYILHVVSILLTQASMLLSSLVKSFAMLLDQAIDTTVTGVGVVNK